MPSIAECAAANMRRALEKCLPAFAPTGVMTTFTQYRRVTAGPKTDLGTPTTPWTLLRSAVVCSFIGVRLEDKSDGFLIPEQGQSQALYYSAYTAQTDIKAGDNVVIALDGRVYNVERAEFVGPVLALLLAHAHGQVVP